MDFTTSTAPWFLVASLAGLFTILGSTLSIVGTRVNDEAKTKREDKRFWRTQFRDASMKYALTLSRVLDELGKLPDDKYASKEDADSPVIVGFEELSKDRQALYFSGNRECLRVTAAAKYAINKYLSKKIDVKTLRGYLTEDVDYFVVLTRSATGMDSSRPERRRRQSDIDKRYKKLEALG
jgi:hypothetical protein